MADQVGTPTYTRDLAQAILNLIDLSGDTGEGPQLPDSPFGIYHFSNEGTCSWYEFACEIVTQLKKDIGLGEGEAYSAHRHIGLSLAGTETFLFCNVQG